MRTGAGLARLGCAEALRWDLRAFCPGGSPCADPVLSHCRVLWCLGARMAPEWCGRAERRVQECQFFGLLAALPPRAVLSIPDSAHGQEKVASLSRACHGGLGGSFASEKVLYDLLSCILWGVDHLALWFMFIGL